MKALIPLMLVIALVLVTGCVNQTKTLGFETIQKGQTSSVANASEFIINSEQELLQLQMNFPTCGPDISISECMGINFTNETIIAVFMGQKGSGGYDIEITGVKSYSSYSYNNEVTVKVTKPGPNCAVTLSLTSPYHIIKTSKINNDTMFKYEENITECESSLEDACVNSGGTVTTSLCCGMTGDFPKAGELGENCSIAQLIGACGCAPQYSHEVKSCDCGANAVWNGSTCQRVPEGCGGFGYECTKDSDCPIPTIYTPNGHIEGYCENRQCYTQTVCNEGFVLVGGEGCVNTSTLEKA
ncbi:protease complex subunit PrcB family protein, partial [Candidatus Micrarchaeota archaeon]|nr:protease complex subunit PrcB family protein [Candidatus Micrarchaeota archaeon]